MDEGLHAVHVLRLFQIGHFYHPANRLSLLQMTQQIVHGRDRKLLERDMERRLTLGLQFTLR
jgi:hypothetical protein